MTVVKPKLVVKVFTEISYKKEPDDDCRQAETCS
jgi:hypothetical protein